MAPLMRDPGEVEAKFLAALRRHLAGWRAKVAADFSTESYLHELQSLRSDSLYPKFSFDRPEYVLVRLMGRMSISIGRRLGEIYDKIPRFVAGARFNLAPESVAPKMQNLELDIGLRLSQVGADDAQHIAAIIQKFTAKPNPGQGVGIEIRYNFNPNDSARLRKDCDMAAYLVAAGLVPIYLVFSGISPRAEAIARLTRAGWFFLVGPQAAEFSYELFGMNLGDILDQPKIRDEIDKEVSALFDDIFSSPAYREVLDSRTQPR
jgi:hypothetical protein